MTKVPEYSRPHHIGYNFAIPVESASARLATIVPVITADEGLGAMSAYESNPENTNFVLAGTDHCYPTSRINKVFAELKASMSKIMLETDKVQIIKFATMEIHSAFNETGQALDEISTLDLNEILELQVETTDRQMYPLFNAIDLADYKSNPGLNMPAETPGLDTDLEIEAVAFQPSIYYNCLSHFTNGDKLRSVATPLKWHTLTRTRPAKTIYCNQHSNTKYMNPYTFLGLLIYVPTMAEIHQIGKPTDTTIETCTIEFTYQARYQEFNHEFNHSLQ